MIVSRHRIAPIQEGMLYQTLASPGVATYVLQIWFEWEEDLDVEKFWRAWEIVTRRHSILRTSFRWQGLDEPHMEVHNRVELPVSVIDLRTLTPPEQEEAFESTLLEERKTGVHPKHAPLMRLALFRMSESRNRFVRTYHHLISDGRSTRQLFWEVFSVYDDLKSGREVDLNPGPAYSEYSGWANQQDLVGAELFWKSELRGSGPASFPKVNAAFARDARSNENPYGSKRCELPESLGKSLANLAQAHSVSLNTVLQAAWGILIGRYSGSQEIVIGATRAGRHSKPASRGGEILGPQMNILPLRIRLPAQATLRELLADLRARWVAMRPFEDTPLIKIVEWIGLGAGQDLFASAYNFDQLDWLEAFRQLSPQRSFQQVELVQYPPYVFSLNASAAPRISLTLTYDRSHVSQALACRITEQLQTLLEGFTAMPEGRLKDLPLLPHTQMKKLLVDWNATRVEYPAHLCAHQVFEEHARRTPEAAALIQEEVSITYGELNTLANQLTHLLLEEGVKPGSLVGICMQRSVEIVIAMLGVLKAGGAYLPLDPDYPQDRLEFMRQDAGVDVILTQEGLQAKVPAGARHVIALDGDWQAAAGSEPYRSENPGIEIPTDQLAYVIYTSGSTGKPKGVMVPHRGITNLLRFHKDRLDIHPGQRLLQFAPFSFDASVWEIWMALGNGAALVLMPAEGFVDNQLLLTYLRLQRVNVITMVPSLLSLLAEGDAAELALPDLEIVIAAGEACPRELVERWARNRRFFNAYGPTETTVCATVGEGHPGDLWLPPIGKPISNVQVYVLDEQLRPVPQGVVGELYIAGVALSTGYLSRPALTAEMFLPNIFGQPGERLFRTGDLVSFREDGNLDFAGRIDNQIKLRGYRVELEEIEAVLASHPDVRQAAVFQRISPDMTDLIAQVVPSNAVSEGDLRAYLAGILPVYMLPAHIIFSEELPMALSGKVDRKALEKSDPQSSKPADFPQVSSDYEYEICRMIEDLLGIQTVSRQDRFFDLGGHSLNVLRLINQIENRFGVRLPVSLVIQEQTPARMAEYLRAHTSQAGRELHAIKRGIQSVPLTYGQESLWYLSQLEERGVHYNVPSASLLKGNLDIHALQESLMKIAQRHEILRTVFRRTSEQVSQVVLPVFEPDFSILSIEHHPAERHASEIEERAVELLHQPFDLERTPAWRVLLIKLRSDLYVLILSFHHILFDEWSLEVFFRELGKIYRAIAAAEPLELPEPPLQYADFALMQADWLKTQEARDQLAFWLESLTAHPSDPDLPSDHPRQARQSIRGASLQKTLPAALTDGIKRFSQASRVTTFTTLLSAFALLLQKFSDQEEVRIASPVSNRQPVEFEDSIGYYLNTLILQLRFSSDRSFTECLADSHQTVLKALENRALPFEHLLHQQRSDRSGDAEPFYRVMFNYFPTAQPRLDLPGVEATTLNYDYGWSKTDLTLYASNEPGGLSLRLVYNRDLFEKQTAEVLLHHYQVLLENILKSPSLPIRDVPVLAEGEGERSILAGQGSRRARQPDRLIHQLFERQVERTPDRAAVSFEGHNLTYRDLNQQANQLAHFLLHAGVRLEDRVGLLLTRSPDLPVAMLAVLKAGAAFVPLEADLPAARLMNMLTDAGVGFVLSHEALLAPELDFSQTPVRHVIVLDREWSAIEVESSENPDIAVSPGNLAYVVYTSGSTGRPKGVMGHHHGTANYLAYLQEEYGFDEQIVVLQATAIGFDASFRDFLLPLSIGGKIVLLSQETVRDPMRLFDAIEKNRVSCILSIVPTMLRAILEAARGRSLPDRQLRWMLISGEELFWEDVHSIRKVFGHGVQIVNQYGPTEGTMTCAFYKTESNPSGHGSLLVGRPIPNVQLYVLDSQLRPVPAGVPGSIFIGGAGVTRGYIDDPALTAEKFIPDPFSDTPGSRLYLSGDRGRYRSDGMLEFMGRQDRQVKVHGVRLEPGEIETVLRTHAQIADCAVIPVPGGSPGGNPSGRQEQHLYAYVVPRPGAGLMVDELWSFLARQIPIMLIPSNFYLLDHLPLTTNGKVDRKALLAVQSIEIRRQADFRKPYNAAEIQVVRIWEDLLGREGIDLDANFFFLGGHSLLAARMLGRVSDHFNIEIPLKTFLKQPTIAALADIIDSLHDLNRIPGDRPLEYEEGEI